MSSNASRVRKSGLLQAFRALGPIDMRNIKRDPLLAPMLLVPLLLWASLRFGLPPLSVWLKSDFGYELESAYPLLVGYAALGSVPIIFAMIAGFLLLDEKDAGTSKALAVTPLPVSAYVAYRTALPFVIAAGTALILIPATGMVRAPLFAVGLTALLGACGAPLYAMALAALAENKVQGMALIKVMSAAQILPVISHFLPAPWHWTGAIVPSYWPLHALLLTNEGRFGAEFFFCLVAGAMIHALCIAFLLKRLRSAMGR